MEEVWSTIYNTWHSALPAQQYNMMTSIALYVAKLSEDDAGVFQISCDLIITDIITTATTSTPTLSFCLSRTFPTSTMY